ncbi:UDP-N-acetyl-D-mannosamine dehydrogenase [Xylanimonas allomyrinae]|uniref:UDP-N-acetyl-D-mannosamine dehydrogenase n=1 Tax=Xylanimonas allomyrinae TaxID=2509459 RepID=A0A4P6EZW5_9MICO|nr:UDP-N-acetyl-D-mannosamine dehydrogenase [Xylanimonas allomyrinae]QAY63618.1 UDP-N-acetyl-D-mannosamine dehydrogenase [Xylanimonas allomyrinae]
MGISSVVVVGLGYIGLPTAAILASNGIDVIGVDVDPRTVDAVNRGVVPFVEPDLSTYVAAAIERGTLRATTEPEPADAFIVAVPTPFKGNHEPDLSYIESAARALAPHLRDDALVILESTSPPGATEQMARWITEVRPDLGYDGRTGPRIHVAHCPERVLPGRVMHELVTNDRIVGGLTHEAALRAQELYAVFCEGQILLTNAVTAEMAKLVENSYRDVNIAFANELSIIAKNLGIDIWELISLANHHPRVNILQPGPGVGGHCIAVDPWFIVDAEPEASRLIRTAREVNDAKPGWVIDQVHEMLQDSEAPTVALLGIAFKPDIDDLRESPALRIAKTLSGEYASGRILAVEPHIDALPTELSDSHNIELVSLDTALAASDATVVLVDHTAFRIEADQIRENSAKFVDTRGLVSKR